MKTITFIAILIFAIPAMSQMVPEDASAVLAGPVIVDGGVGLTIGYSKEVLGLQLVALGRFGETPELEGEAVKLFKLTGKLYVGPIAGAGVDWSDKAGTDGELVASYLFGAAGIATAYVIAEHVGAWGFWRRQITEKENVPVFGAGLYYKF